MAIKNITFAQVMTQEKDRSKLTDLRLTISGPKHIISGTPHLTAGHVLGLNAKNNYGEDNEDIMLQVVRIDPPTIYNRSITTHNDKGIDFTPQGIHCTLSKREVIEWVHWTAKGLPYELQMDPNTGHIRGLLTKGGTYNIEISCTTIWGTGTGVLTINVVAYNFWVKASAPDCPVAPGSYNGYHDHGASVRLPDGVVSIYPIETRSTTSYGERRITLSAKGTNSKTYKFLYYPKEGEPYEKKVSCYGKLHANGHISGGRKVDKTTYTERYEDCHYWGRVKVETVETHEGAGPSGFYYVDVDFTYDFAEVPNFKYDKNGVIKTYS